jgi:hypothetical protein
VALNQFYSSVLTEGQSVMRLSENFERVLGCTEYKYSDMLGCVKGSKGGKMQGDKLLSE